MVAIAADANLIIVTIEIIVTNNNRNTTICGKQQHNP
jgi:hypothetical protein